ncbi:hypothetical protein Vretifemale_18560, partial [Volvox reticuliferus]
PNSVTAVIAAAAAIAACSNSSKALQPEVLAARSRSSSATAPSHQVPGIESRPASIATPPRCSRPGSVTTAQCLAPDSEWEPVSGISEPESEPRPTSVDASRSRHGSTIWRPGSASLQPQLMNPESRPASPAAPQQQPEAGFRVGSAAVPQAQTQNAKSRPASASTPQPLSASRSASRPRSGSRPAFTATSLESQTFSRPASATTQTQPAYSGSRPVSATVPSSLKETPFLADPGQEQCLLVAAGGQVAIDQPLSQGGSSAEGPALARVFDCNSQDAEWPVDANSAEDQEQPAIQRVTDAELVTEGTAVVLVTTQAADLEGDEVIAEAADVADAVAGLKSELPSLNTLELEVGLGRPLLLRGEAGGSNVVRREGRTRTGDEVAGGVELVQAFLTEMVEKEAKGKADDPTLVAGTSG